MVCVFGVYVACVVCVVCVMCACDVCDIWCVWLCVWHVCDTWNVWCVLCVMCVVCVTVCMCVIWYTPCVVRTLKRHSEISGHKHTGPLYPQIPHLQIQSAMEIFGGNIFLQKKKRLHVS